MPRPFTAPERALLGAEHINLHVRVEVMNADGTWIDLTDLFGLDWVDGAKWSEDIDTPVLSGEVTLRREAYAPDSGVQVSLAPMIEASLANRRDDGVTYAPLLNPRRRIRIFTAVTAPAIAPVSGDWKEVVTGYIDTVDPTAGPNELSVTFRDLGAELQRRFIEVGDVYGSLAGVALETVIQQVIDDNFDPGERPTLYTPVSPGWMVHTMKEPLEDMTVMAALEQLALQIGWLIRYRYDAAGVSRLTLYAPNRAATVPDYTFGPDEYFAPEGLELSDANIRNRVRVGYLDAASREWRTEIREVAASITEFGPRFMEVQEDASSNIDSASEAGAMAQAAADDLAFPKAEQEIPTLPFWPAQLGDFVAFLPNGRHYDSEQRLGVTGLRTQIAGGHGTTIFATRGQPAGAYYNWLRRGKGGTPTNPLPPGLPRAFIDFLGADFNSNLWSVRFRGILGEGVVGTMEYRYKIEATLGGTLDDWTPWATLPPEGIEGDLAMDPFAFQYLTLEVRDPNGAVARATDVIQPTLPSMDTATGRIDRSEAFSDTKYAAGALDTNGVQLPTTVRIKDSVTSRIAVRGEQRFTNVKNGDVLTFNPVYPGTPDIDVRVATAPSLETRTKYNATGDGTGTTAYDPTLPTIMELLAVNASASSATIRGRLRQPGSGGTTQVTHQFAANSLTAIGHATPARNLDSAPAVDDTYSARFNVAIDIFESGPAGTITATVIVALEVDHGTGFLERSRQSFTTTHEATFPSSGNPPTAEWLSQVLSAVQTSPRMDNTDDVRLIIADITVSGPGTAAVVVQGHDGSTGALGPGVFYNTSAGDLYASMTPSSDPYASLTVIVREGAL